MEGFAWGANDNVFSGMDAEVRLNGHLFGYGREDEAELIDGVFFIAFNQPIKCGSENLFGGFVFVAEKGVKSFLKTIEK